MSKFNGIIAPKVMKVSSPMGAVSDIVGAFGRPKSIKAGWFSKMKKKHGIHRFSTGCVPSDKVGCGRAKLDKNLYNI
jgi:hypothetical protein